MDPIANDRFRPDIVVEPQREVPVTGSYDVVVVGGGMAGVGARAPRS